MHLFQCAEPILGEEPADVLRTIAFMANLAAQETTGRIDASRGVGELFDALAHPSPESTTLVFALSPDPVPEEAPTSDLGYPLIPSSGAAAEPECVAWLIVNVPELDNRHSIDADIVLDVDLQPLPEEAPSQQALEVISSLLDHVTVIANQLSRHTIHLWQQHALGATASGTWWNDVFASHGFLPAYTQVESAIPVPASQVDVPDNVLVVSNADFPEDVLEDVTELYTLASTDQPLGTLDIEPSQWDIPRLKQNTAHFRALGTENYHALGLSAAGKVVAISEVWIHQGFSPEVAIMGLTYVHPKHRDPELAVTVARAAIDAARAAHPELTTIYSAWASDDAAQQALGDQLGSVAVGQVSAWQSKN